MRSIKALTCMAVVSVVALADTTSALEARRNLVETARGLWVENNYVAVCSGQEYCDALEDQIKQWKKENAWHLRHFRAAGDGSDDIVEKVDLEELSFFHFIGPVELAKFVESLPGVEDVEYDVVVESNQAPPSWGLNRIDQANLPLSRNTPFQTPYTGKDVNIYIVDTGLYVDHVEFDLPGNRRRALLGGDFVKEVPLTDNHGHGTHCAGTAAGSTYGIATDSLVYGVKVLSSTGGGTTSSVIKGIEWAVKHQQNNYGGQASVISMSLGSAANQALDKAAREASRKHIVVVAAGNSNIDACRSSPSRAGGRGQRGSVITVGSTDETDTRSRFSNYGKCVDIFAPGSKILSSWIGPSNRESKVLSGTSMATPHVAGVAATLLEKHGHNKIAAIKELFQLAAKQRVKDPGNRSPNLLLQSLRGTASPTLAKPPTPQPTMPPTILPVTLCIDNDSICTRDFVWSRFGPSLGLDQIIRGALVEPKDKTFCNPSQEDFTDKVVLIRRGGCGFFEKVWYAEQQGAKAVLLYMNNRDALFPPSHYGTGKTNIVSLLASRTAGNQFRKRKGKTVILGSKTFRDGGPEENDNEDNGDEGRNEKGLVAPDHCKPRPFQEAEKECASLNAHVCTKAELDEFGIDAECDYDRKYIWTSDACNRGRQMILNVKRNRKRCRPTRKRFGFRCCKN